MSRWRARVSAPSPKRSCTTSRVRSSRSSCSGAGRRTDRADGCGRRPPPGGRTRRRPRGAPARRGRTRAATTPPLRRSAAWRGSHRRVRLPRMQPEIRRAQLHPDPRRLQPLAAQPARDGVRGPQQPGADGGLPDDVRVQRVLRADALRVPLRDHRTVVASVCEGVHVGAEAAQPALQGIERGRRDVADGVQPPRLEPRAGARPHPPEPIDRQWMEKVDHLVRADHGHSVGLAVIAGDLRDVLGGGGPDRDGELRGLEDRAAHRLAHRPRLAEQRLASGHVHERLVEAQGFDERREVAEGAHHRPRYRLVTFEAGREHDRVRTAPPRDGHGHRAADPERARLVARRGHHPARPRPSDQQRLAAQLRPVELLDRRVECVHVGVQDDAWPGRGHDPRVPARRAAARGLTAPPPVSTARGSPCRCG